MFKSKHIKFNTYGMTLLETTVALGILMIGVMSSLALMMSSFNFVEQSEHEIIVVNLAREGIEIMRSIRNNEQDIISTDIDIFDGTTYNNTKYYLDSSTTNDTSSLDQVYYSNASLCGECTLYIDSAGKYTHTVTANPTIYKRMISILPGIDNDEKIITSEVSWTVKGKTYNYILETQLTNWQ